FVQDPVSSLERLPIGLRLSGCPGGSCALLEPFLSGAPSRWYFLRQKAMKAVLGFSGCPLLAIQLRHSCSSAGSRDLFCNRLFKMLNILAREIGADTPDEFCFAQEPIRFGDCPLGV